ncbi:MAG: hypothetical protein HY820_45175 [Acidobacteria bacterium]|nr:hypothetical protein [Acidobacteriota bacterium]
MAITVRPNPTTLAWSNFTTVSTLSGNEDAHIDFNFVIPNRPLRRVGGNFMLAETFEIGVSPIAKVKQGANQTAALLAHEQGHYDIAIAVAWALAADLQTLSAASQGALSTALTTTFNLHRTTRMAAVQQGYDTATGSSQNAAQQAAWLTAIATALTSHASTLQGLPL